MRILLCAKQRSENYIRAIEACGAEAVLSSECRDYASCDGLLLCGGNDIHPSYYGQEINGSIKIDIERDRHEFSAVKEFLRTKKPILAICRGFQLLNVALGGTLIQHIENASLHSCPNCDLIHKVFSTQGSIYSKMYGEGFFVNSAHHQCLDKLGNGLMPTLYSDDGKIVEGYEHSTLPYFGTQFHPERMCLDLKRENTVDGIKIFEHFIGLCEAGKI